jgi:uncharacterized protein (DUF1330 family)
MSTKITLVVSLYINLARESAFEQFETAAAQIMRRYGGLLERRIAITPAPDNRQPHEVHLVTFPDEKSFEQYRTDPDLQALADLRARAIRQTILWSGLDLPHFDESSLIQSRGDPEAKET